MRPVPAPALRRVLAALLPLLAAAFAAPAGAQERVSLPGPDGVTLQAALWRPAGPGPHPAVIALHGCGGLDNRAGRPSARHADWGERLAAAGFFVLMPDSFASRGLPPQCTVKERQVRPSRERVEDAQAALAWLAARPDVKRSAISLLGWSNGGGTVLYAMRRKAPGNADFARAVSFYPGCRVPARRGDFASRRPLMILIGEADDWTPAGPCRTLAAQAEAARAAGRGEAVTLLTYPGAVHDFDHPSLTPRTRSGLAFTGSGTGTARTGTDRKAREDAIRRVPAFLAR